jgi:RNA polymerase sigma factor (sigma-70 family)
MRSPPDTASAGNDRRSAFATTQWSVVLAAADDPDSVRARDALETLCRAYWKPLYVYARRQGYGEADAEDLVQGFFARILARRDLQAVRRERGRFRSYLLGALKHFLVNEWKRSTAQKRGGVDVAVSLEASLESGAAVSDGGRSPDQQFDRQWALALLARVLEDLRVEHAAEGREALFHCLRGFLTGDDATRSQAELAAELGISEPAVKQAVFRLRQRYQKRLREEVADTVAAFGDVDQELRHLVAALRA